MILQSNTFKVSNLKNHTVFKTPKNFKTSSLEAYCANKSGVILWCYFSSELGIFLKNLNTRSTERILTIEGVQYLDIDYNTVNGTYILLYKKEESFFLRYSKDFEYVTKSLSLNCDTAFVHFSSLYNKSMIIFKDKTSNKIIELNSDDDFEWPLELTQPLYNKQEITQIGLNEELGTLAFDIVVTDNSLLEDLELYPKFKDKVYREYPINISEFSHA